MMTTKKTTKKTNTANKKWFRNLLEVRCEPKPPHELGRENHGAKIHRIEEVWWAIWKHYVN